MSGTFRNWLMAGCLLGAFACAGAPVARAQGRVEPAPGTRADRREDRRELQILKQRIQQDQYRLRTDLRLYGKRSAQVRADREQLRRDNLELQRLRRDMRRDRRIARFR
jgi:hypothetical protein